jgi:hypothetical protein
MDEETGNTNTTYYQYSWKDYIQFGKKIKKLYKSGSGNPCTFSQSHTHTSAWDNTVYNMHTVHGVHD